MEIPRPALYVITDNVHLAHLALKGGADIIQLRVKGLTDKEFLKRAIKIRNLTTKHNAIFIVNDRPDIAAISMADGVHLGQEDLPIKKVRKFFKTFKFIGISSHSLEEAVNAEKAGADYIGVGCIYPSTTKRLHPAGTELLKMVKNKVKIPIVAIGGINASNIKEVLKTGINIVAVSSALLTDANPTIATEQLKKLINEESGHDCRF